MAAKGTRRHEAQEQMASQSISVRLLKQWLRSLPEQLQKSISTEVETFGEEGQAMGATNMVWGAFSLTELALKLVGRFGWADTVPEI